jgi:hypothetical protein
LAIVAGNDSSALAGSGAGNAALTFGDRNSVSAGGNSVGNGPTSNLNIAVAAGFGDIAGAGSSTAPSNGNIAGALFSVDSAAHAFDGNANVAAVVAGSSCAAHAGGGNLNAAGVLGVLPGTDGLSAAATGNLTTSFKFLPSLLNF